MEIELTSSRDDGTYTWRAAGARQPKGLVAADLLSAGAKVGDVLRVEAEVELDGITILQVLPNKEHTAERSDRIELRPERPATGGVTTQLVSREDRRGRDRRGPRDGGDRPRREPRDRQEGAARSPRPSTDRAAGRERAPRAAAPREGAPREGAEGAPRRTDAARRPPTRQRPARIVPGRVHLDALLESLAPERRPIAEQLAIGGLPKVRRALAEEQAAARSEGRPAASGDAIVAIAEELQKSVREATWRDRADAAAAHLEQISLRDLRAAVVGAAPQNDEGRALLATLREALDTRLTKLRTTWEQEMTHALDEGRVLQALRSSARPPEPTARFPAALVSRLAESAGAALASDVPSERWIALLDAAAASPIRRSIRPAGLPDDPSGAVRQAATAAAGRVPALAKLLGLAMPPPPRPVSAPPRPPAPAADRRPVPPPPPLSPVEAPASELPVVAEEEPRTSASELAAGDEATTQDTDDVKPADEGVTADDTVTLDEVTPAAPEPPATPSAEAASANGDADSAGAAAEDELPVDGDAVGDEPVEEPVAQVESGELA